MKRVLTSLNFKVLILSILFLAGISESKAQGCPADAIEILLPDTLRFQANESFCVPVTINNFRDIVIFVFAVNFDSRVLRFDRAVTTVSGLPSFTSNDVIGPFPPNSLDIIRVLWASPNVVGETLPDGTTLLELCFTVVGNPGTDSPICINSNGLNSPLDFINERSMPLQVCLPSTCPVIEPVPPVTDEPQGFISNLCGSGLIPNSGVVEMRIFYGTSPYTIIDENGESTVMSAGENRFIRSGMSQGPHTFTIVDANGLTSTPVSFIIDDTPPFNVTSTVRLPRCPDEDNGRITLSVTGGRPFSGGRYFFNWGPDALGLNLLERNNIRNGIYTVIIEDSLGCRQVNPIEMRREEIGLNNIVVTDAACEGRNNGRIEISGIGGGPYSNGGYDYTISGLTNNGTPFNQSRDRTPRALFNMLPPGQYVITARDSIGRGNCFSPPSDSITIDYSTNYQANITTGTSPTCTNADEIATINLSGSTGNPPFNIVIRNGTNQSVFNRDDVDDLIFSTGCLEPGSYSLQLTDFQGCVFDTNFSLMGCDLVVDDPVIVEPGCSGDPGAISILASSSRLPIRYLWSTGDTTTSIVVPAGNYTVTITDADSCVYISPALTIADPPTFVLNFTENSIACPGGVGSIIVMPNGGTAPYEYEWNPDPANVNNSVLTNVREGVYAVTVTDDNGCEEEGIYTISDPTPPNISVTNVSAPLCLGENTGRAIINATLNNDFLGPFSYLSSTGLRSNDPNFSVTNFPPGRNWVIVSTQACVFDTVFINIPEANSLRIDRDSSSVSTIECFGGAGLQGATVNLRAAGNASVNFQWPDGDITNVKLGLSAGTYAITLSTPTCSAVDTLIITQPDSLGLRVDNINSVFPQCGGSTTADVIVLASGGTPAANNQYNFQWFNSMNTLISSTNQASNLPTDNYRVRVTDANNCATEITIPVEDAAVVFGILGELSFPLCEGDQGIIRIDSAYGGEGNYRYQINTFPAIPINQPTTVLPGTYDLRIFDLAGCSWDTMVTIPPAPILSISASSDVEVELGNSTDLSADIINTVPLNNIAWTPSVELICLNADCDLVTVTPARDQIYRVTVTDINGCTAIDDVLVSVVQSRNVYIPNTFHPRAVDPQNRFFRIFTGTGVELIDFFRIYDRWGNLIHEENNLLPNTRGAGAWTGNMNNRELDPGVYVYVVQVRYIGNPIPEIRKGDVTLIR